MSFGFGVGDFLSVGQLVLRLYNACEGAPEEFQELRRDLSSIHIVLSGLESQVADPSSLLRQICGDRNPEWMQLRTNLEATLEELEDLVQRYRKMGRKAWLRVQLGLKDLNNLRGKLTIHLAAINALFGSASLSSLGRLEQQIGRLEPVIAMIAQMVLEFVKEEKAGIKAPTVLSAQEIPDGPEWNRLEMELVIGGVAREEIERNSEKIKELVDWIVSDTGELEGLAEVEMDDSFSQQGLLDDNIHYERNKHILEQISTQEPPLASMKAPDYDSTGLGPAPPRETRIQYSPNYTIPRPPAIEVSKHSSFQPDVKILVIDDDLSRKSRARFIATLFNSD
jgi:hypothetical protein